MLIQQANFPVRVLPHGFSQRAYPRKAKAPPHGSASSGIQMLNEPSASRLSREHVLIDLLRIAEHNETYVAHVFLRDALHVRRRDRAQLFQKYERVAPTATD